MHEPDELDLNIRALIESMSPETLRELIDTLPDAEAEALVLQLGGNSAMATPLDQATHLVRDFVGRPHLMYLSARIAQALSDVENGVDRRLIVQMPPRMGKSLLATQVAAAWVLARHPDWPVVLTSYSGSLATQWGRQVRRWADDGALGSAVKVAADAGAAASWETTEGGVFLSRSIREPLTGYGAKVLIVDDPHKDHADAHSKVSRDAVWHWWLTVAQLRLHPPSLVIVVQTRWHEDDFAGRLLSDEYPGDPDDWEVISFPAIAEATDVLGRAPGQPLYSPLADEDEAEAIERWDGVKRDVGSYSWSSLFQQHPSPADGTIFMSDWWQFWTTDAVVAARGDNVVHIDPAELPGAQWLDSWDLTFDKSDTSDFAVGQRWVRSGANRYLIAQKRERMSFTETIKAMLAWASADPVTSPYGHLVHKRVIEKKANGAAAIDTIKSKVSGIKAVSPSASKETRARAVTPEIESGNVFLPHPSMPGCAWVMDFIAEYREFPSGAHDDQVDTGTQALMELREAQGGSISMPGSRSGGNIGRRGSANAVGRRKPR